MRMIEWETTANLVIFAEELNSFVGLLVFAFCLLIAVGVRLPGFCPGTGMHSNNGKIKFLALSFKKSNLNETGNAKSVESSNLTYTRHSLLENYKQKISSPQGKLWETCVSIRLVFIFEQENFVYPVEMNEFHRFSRESYWFSWMEPDFITLMGCSPQISSNLSHKKAELIEMLEKDLI